VHSIVKMSESPFEVRFVERFSDEIFSTVTSPESKLHDFLKLAPGWYNGRGERVSATAFRIARKLLGAAHGGIIDAADVFPRADGGVTVAVYYSNRDLAFNIKPTGLVDVDSETQPDFPFLEGLSEAHALFIIQGLRQWNWSSSSTFHSTMKISIPHVFEALVSKDQRPREFRYSFKNVPKKHQAPYVLMPGLSIAK
jgi:hypothetical protein